MIATNIQWDIDIEDAIEKLDRMTEKAAAKTLGLPLACYNNKTKEERHKYAYNHFKQNPTTLRIFMGLPKETGIPEGLTNEDEISDWLSDTYGYCHKGFTLKKSPRETLVNIINNCLPNQYKVLETTSYSLVVKDRESNTNLEINIKILTD